MFRQDPARTKIFGNFLQQQQQQRLMWFLHLAMVLMRPAEMPSKITCMREHTS